ncbi:MAG TPA: WhiB family transcriptional regulator [Mycobacterium sp.]|nr:WhiB family transcriptional regulator [Mycobacterium sp.]
MGLDETPLGACTRDPDRWTQSADEGAKAICRACPRRWRCAQEACETPAAEGIWAGILIPEAGRGRQFALRQLRSLAERNGFPARNPQRVVAQSPAGDSIAS